MLTVQQRKARLIKRTAIKDAAEKVRLEAEQKMGFSPPGFYLPWYLRANAFAKKSAKLFVPSSYECTRRSDGTKYNRSCIRAVADGATEPVRRKGDWAENRKHRGLSVPA